MLREAAGGEGVKGSYCTQLNISIKECSAGARS